MKKILLIIITAIILNLIILSGNSLVFANTESDLSKGTFNVREWLDIDPASGSTDTQPQTYFETKCTVGKDAEGPIICFTLTILDFATQIIGSIALILIIISGFMLMLAQGNQQKLDEAKDIAKYAVIGLIITFMSYIITIFVQGLFISR